MADELQNLIERIQRDGVDKARAEAEEIVSKARIQATGLVKSAEKQAQFLLKKAEADAQVYTERGIRDIGHAGRDVLIAVGHGVEKLFKDLIRESLAESLTPGELMEMIVALAKGYADHGMSESRIDVLVSPEDQEKLKKLYLEKYRQALGKGVEIRSDDNIVKGFKISLEHGKVYHDFTQEAIADAMSAFLQPQLEEIVRRMTKERVE